VARSCPVEDLEPLASLVQRLGVLLAAGVAPASAWHYLADAATGPMAERVRSVAGAADGGAAVADALVAVAASGGRNDPAWRGLAAAWLVATEAGAPLAPTLGSLAASLRSLAKNARDLTTARAGPVATARMVMVLPAVGMLFALALGFDSLGALVTTAPGLVCLGSGLVLMVLARLWNRRLVTAATPTNHTPGLGLDLMAIAVSGGTSLTRARQVVVQARERCGLAPDGTDAAIDDVLELSSRAGVPAAALLRSEAIEARRIARSDGERKAATLGVLLMLPLGLCILPAFMLLAVAPLLIAVISSTVGSLG
jgi:tight adherence protein B